MFLSRYGSAYAIGELIVCHAGVTQLVECQLPKLDVAGSSPVTRSIHLRFL
jgi:hypothetical protein